MKSKRQKLNSFINQDVRTYVCLRTKSDGYELLKEFLDEYDTVRYEIYQRYGNVT